MKYGQPSPAIRRPADHDAVMREAMRREAVEVMAHQLKVERGEQSRVVRGDMFMSALIFGGFAAAGYVAYRSS